MTPISELFVDTANINEIKSLVKSSAVRGVTTNPSLVAKEKNEGYEKKIFDIIEAVNRESTWKKRHVSIEATSIVPKEIYETSLYLDKKVRSLRFTGVDLFLKVPVTLENLEVITALSREGVQVNATACMTALQAKIASDAGAKIVSFFYNRIKDGGGCPDNEITKYVSFGCSADVICGSIRKKEDVFDAWAAGARYVTASSKVIQDMLFHEQTDKAISQFQKDIEKWLS